MRDRNIAQLFSSLAFVVQALLIGSIVNRCSQSHLLSQTSGKVMAQMLLCTHTQQTHTGTLQTLRLCQRTTRRSVTLTYMDMVVVKAAPAAVSLSALSKVDVPK